MSTPVTLAICGAGYRGLIRYGAYAEQYGDLAKVVAVAEPREWFRNHAIEKHKISESGIFSDWREMVKQPRLADAVIVSTQDKDHTEPAIAFMNKGYDVLLEKPMATTEAECRQIVEAAKKNNVLLAVCHVLRYSPYFRKLKEIVDSGILGKLTTVRHAERIGFWHFAHSYVRGNWRNEALASPMILAKCCHDMDILRYLIGKKCLHISSFGSLTHFKKSECPPQAPQNNDPRCLDCTLADSGCPYSAKSFYGQMLERRDFDWPLNIITQDYTKAGLEKALREGPYGRCVYHCDNDVCDHQVVQALFEDGITAEFTASAFTDKEERHTEIMGTHGELFGDTHTIKVTDFRNRQTIEYPVTDLEVSDLGGHLGGDYGIMHDFVQAVKKRDPQAILSGPDVSLESHLMAFAAERSRKSLLVEKLT
jgi:predicted dehydrogenase